MGYIVVGFNSFPPFSNRSREIQRHYKTREGSHQILLLWKSDQLPVSQIKISHLSDTEFSFKRPQFYGFLPRGVNLEGYWGAREEVL